MRVNLVTMSVADYCQMFDRNEVLINKRYQRNPAIWPVAPRSYLIETILLNYPVPKLALHQVTDLVTRRTRKEVVDGQQRTHAIRDFYEDKLRLSRTIETAEAAGRTYSELASEFQEAFLSYQLTFDQFENASETDVRDYFRRINSFTAPLNAEEQRHARYQGPMKWLINRLSATYGPQFVRLGVLNERQVIRMADAKLISEVVHAMLNGVETTSKAKLDALYQAFEREAEVPTDSDIRQALQRSFDQILEFDELRETPILTKTHIFYSLWLAVIGVQARSVGQSQRGLSTEAQSNLLELAAALEEGGQAARSFRDFVEASGARTNVKSQREARILWLSRALTNEGFYSATQS